MNENNNAIYLLLDQLKIAHEALEVTMSDVTSEQAVKYPGENTHSIASTYAHVYLVEDLAVHGILQGLPPLSATVWKEKNGVSIPMPLPGVDWENYPEWTKTVTIDFIKFKEYIKGVVSDTTKYITGLTDKNLQDEVDMTRSGMGKVTVKWVLSVLVIGHINNVMGEIVVLKGLQGLKGYPF